MDAQTQLDGFLDKYVPDTAAQARAALAKMKAQLPGATMLVYDNYNALVIGFGATDKPSKAVLSLAVLPRHVTLCFIHGKGLPDPHALLQGEGKVVARFGPRVSPAGESLVARIEEIVGGEAKLAPLLQYRDDHGDAVGGDAGDLSFGEKL